MKPSKSGKTQNEDLIIILTATIGAIVTIVSAIVVKKGGIGKVFRNSHKGEKRERN